MKKYYFTSESVTEGHPDKVCDLVSDTILDECLKQDKYSRVAVETFASKNLITIAGQLTTKAKINVEQLARNVLKEIGYDNENTDIDYRTCKILINITKQSPGIMFGYASDETKELMPFAIAMAHKISKRLTEVRKNKEIDYLRPDGKVQVTVEYQDDIPKRIDTILISNQHLDSIDLDTMKKDITEKVINKVVDRKYIDENTGLTGRKIIVGTYGGYAKHGGGAFSGKDASKVDRSSTYMLRHIAKSMVASGLAKKCELQISYAIGMKEPLSIFINTFGTNTISEEEIIDKIKEKFDLTPNGIIEYLNLREPIYTKTTNYGHFGDKDLPWEKVVKL